MARIARLVHALPVAAIALLAPAEPASAGSRPWFAAAPERPIVYRPVVTPRTYYFAPAEIRPAPHRHHRHHRNHRPAR